MIPRYRPPILWKDIFSPAEGQGHYREIENAFQKKYGYRYCVWFPYARVAIKAYLECLGQKKGNFVAVSPFNCIALGNAITAAGHTPYFVDTEKRGFNEDPNRFLESLLERKVSAGISVSLWGIPAKTPAPSETKKPILHDYCLMGLNTQAPPLKDQDAVVYSLGWGKPITSLKGAILCGNTDEVAQKWRHWQQKHINRHAKIFRNALELLLLKVGSHPWVFSGVVSLADYLPFVRQMTGHSSGKAPVLLPSDWHHIPRKKIFLAGLRNLQNFDSFAQERAKQINFYHESLKNWNDENFLLPPPVPTLSHYALRLREADHLHEYLMKKGIFTSNRLFDRLLLDYGWLGDWGSERTSNARQLTKTALHLPLYPGLTQQSQEKIVERIKQWIRSQAPERSFQNVIELPWKRVS